jgi:CheY-like chemotaxis protein
VTQTRILIVEDEAVVALSERFILESLGYRVVATVDSGERALELIEKTPPDVVLMDVLLQGRMDGLEAARQVDRRFGIPVVFVTAHDDDDLVGRAGLSGISAHVSKPFRETELRQKIEQVLRGGGR